MGIVVVVNTTLPSPSRATRGRPRDPERDRAILEAAREVLAAKGFTGTSMERIAKTAGVGKDTLYRRWSSKEDLVHHLLKTLAEEGVPAPDLDDDPRFALFLFLQAIVRINTESSFGPILAGLVGESARNPAMAERFHDFWVDRRRVAGGIVRQAVGPEPSDADVERVLDHVLGPIYYRLLLTGAAVTDEYLWDLVTGVPWPATHETSTQ